MAGMINSAVIECAPTNARFDIRDRVVHRMGKNQGMRGEVCMCLYKNVVLFLVTDFLF